jgi:hypothetical protein
MLLTRLHYIPLSSSYKEVYNIHAYFFGPSGSMRRMANNATVLPSHPKARRYDGGARLRQIAKAGRQWKSTIMRNVDMEGEPDSFIHSIVYLIHTSS